MRAEILLPLYLLIACAPLALAAAQGLPTRRFLDEVSSGAAAVAFAVMLCEFVLSGRFQSISGRIGMDLTMRFHQLLARSAVALALIHPFLYSTPLAFPLPWDTTRQLTLGLDSWSLASGVLAWIVLPALVLLAIFRKRLDFSYETWRLLHGVGALVLAALVTHHAVAAGRYSRDPLLAWFWFVLLGVGLVSLAYVYLIKPLRQRARPYAVKSVRRLALKTWELLVEPRGHAGPDFAAGQFVWLNVGHSSFSLRENPFSISSAPAQEPEIGFVIKEAGDFTRRVARLQPGTIAYLDGPHGNLTLEGRAGKGIALIAGGVGIAPLLGILRQLKYEGDTRPVILVYGNRVEEQIVYGQELEGLVAEGRIELAHLLSEPPPGWSGRVGMVDGETVATTFGFEDAPDWLYFICGPPAMIETVEAALIAQGVPARQIVSERFDYD